MKFQVKELNLTRDVSTGNYDELWSIKTLKFAFGLVVVFFILFSLMDIALSQFPDDLERNLFDNTEAIKEKKVFKEEQERVEKILDKLIAANEDSLRDLPYTIKVVEKGYENAFAAIGGKIYVTKKLIERSEEETGLAFIIAHELAHHQLRHCSRGKGRAVLYQIFTSFLNPEGLISMQFVPALTMKASNRGWEKNADRLAFELISNTYQELDKFLDFFERDAAKGNAFSDLDQSYLGSHPASKDRIKYLQELQANASN